jgi:iron complex outermembrane receptor protein
VGAGAADWRIDARSTLTSDFEYQHKTERSQSGYQLLGGTALPDLSRIYRSTMLGFEPWQKPNIFDVFTASSRYARDLSEGWRLQVVGSFSHSLIDDNVVYAYGCTGSPQCTDMGGTSPDYYFAPDGSYDIFDYRNPGELRIDAVGQALVNGRLKTGPLTHKISAGGELFLRSVRMPGAPPAGSPDWISNGSVYAYIGSENIYQPQSFFPGATDINGVRLQAGPRTLKEDNHQSSLLLEDRIRIPGGFQLIAGGRYDALRDHNFSAGKNTDKNIWLPQFAATYNPVANVTFYGNYGVLLSLGQQAPWWTTNGSIYLSPYYTRQAEIGAKFTPTERLLVTTAFFRMHAPNFYPRLLATADATCATAGLCFEADGREHHEGIEISAEGKAARWLRLTGSATAMNAKSLQTSTPTYNDKQIINQPHLRTALFADLSVPYVHGLHLLPGWNYTGRKEATRDNTVSVTSYNIFNLGARYTPGGENGKITFRLFADNIANKTYWKDTGTSGGDSFLYLGAPTTIRLAAHYTF